MAGPMVVKAHTKKSFQDSGVWKGMREVEREKKQHALQVLCGQTDATLPESKER